ncbi:MAG: hypothetical protein DI597_15045 [Pseudoxanthomonas spadix]|nr:MAG: hypothetical protein DI597_15045 [Pseudoxanthomonas spadix]
MIDDKFQQHYRQQMSALMDGALAPDQARFLMKRMADDETLAATWERWQLCGDVLRGQAQAPAPQGFADRVAAAIAAQPVQSAANQAPARGGRVLRWGGGAIAAAVALVAVFMAGQQSGRPSASPETPALASASAPAPSPAQGGATPVGTPADAGSALTASSALAVASLPRRAEDSRRGSATRNQQAARATAAITRQALAAVNAPAPAAAAAIPQDPFAGSHLGQPAARPWPRSSLSQLRGNGAYATGYATGDQASYYPFQPRVPVSEPASPAQPAPAQP